MSGSGADATLSVMLLSGMAGMMSLALCVLIVLYGPRDGPDGARKTQVRAVATSGGLGVLGAVGLALSVLALMGERAPAPPIPVPGLVLVAGATLVGVVDDVRQLPARLKLALLAGLCLLAAGLGSSAETIHVPFAGPVDMARPLAIAGTALFLFVTMNALNFMDGANGLAAGTIVPASLTLGWVSRGQADPVTALMAALIGALVGFLAWNLRGRLYLGDAGALGIGALLGVVAIEVQARVRLGATQPGVWFCAALFLPFFVDVFLTLAWRAREGRALLSAHREHAFQLLMRAGWPHWRVALVWWGFGIVSAIVALVAAHLGPSASFWAFWSLVCVGTGLWTHQRRKHAALLNKAD